MIYEQIILEQNIQMIKTKCWADLGQSQDPNSYANKYVLY